MMLKCCFLNGFCGTVVFKALLKSKKRMRVQRLEATRRRRMKNICIGHGSGFAISGL